MTNLLSFDMERILRLMRPSKDEVLIKESGMHAVENFIMKYVPYQKHHMIHLWNTHHVVNNPFYPHRFVKKSSKWKLVISMISSQIDADRMDYLQRDAYFTGVSYGAFDQFIMMRFINYFRNFSWKLRRYFT
jgi:HD superfamily phosphohydrolase